jgi:selenide,water dikinase
VGLEKPDDAGVYRLTNEIALIQTVDFFTPIVDDPYTFGAIAAANALSDVYAMGGWPICAMNIVCFPAGKMDIEVLRDILRGGLDKLREAKTVLAGGHSIQDPELKFGLSVTGLVHPDRVLTNQGARPGDHLILTKPLGTGIIATAVKAGEASPEAQEQAIASMMALNRRTAEIMVHFPVHACTDITGFGLIGHTCEMLEGADLTFVIDSSAVPLFSGVRQYAEMGFLPGGLHRNREYRQAMTEFSAGVPDPIRDVLFDPQTSGGMLIALEGGESTRLCNALREAGVDPVALIGIVEPGRGAKVRVE